MATAIKEVERHYKLPVLSPEKVALVTLAWVAGRIYVPMARDVYAEAKGRTRGEDRTQDAARQAAQPVTADAVPDPLQGSDWLDVLNPDPVPPGLH